MREWIKVHCFSSGSFTLALIESHGFRVSVFGELAMEGMRRKRKSEREREVEFWSLGDYFDGCNKRQRPGERNLSSHVVVTTSLPVLWSFSASLEVPQVAALIAESWQSVLLRESSKV